MEDENEVGQRFAVDVHDFVEVLLARQADFESEIRKKQEAFEAATQAKLDALDQVVKTALKEALNTLTATVDRRMNWRPPDPGKASSN